MSDLFVSLVCFMVPVVCLVTGAALTLTLIQGNVRARVRAEVEHRLDVAHMRVETASNTSKSSITNAQQELAQDAKPELLEIAC
jgi:hypothetical protein